MKKFKSYKEVKICCYAICADEPEASIDRWLDSMSGADYIAVLVTKKDNPNYTYFLQKQALPEFKNKLIVKEREIKPWRFDTARNASMELIPEDTDACVSTDIDEILIPDFWDDYRKCVFLHPNFQKMVYQYAWSHDDATGEPKWVFWYDKCHSPKGWIWRHPVHEALHDINDAPLDYARVFKISEDKIYLHHYQDKSKNRSSYLDLLKIRIEETPDDIYSMYYLQREYTFMKQWEESLAVAIRLYAALFKHGATFKNPIDNMTLASACIAVGLDFDNLRMKEDAEHYYLKAIQCFPELRDSYIRLAQLYAYTNDSQKAYDILATMEEKSKPVSDWRVCSYFWKDWKKHQIMATAKYCEGKYDEAEKEFRAALADLKTQDDQIDAFNENLYRDIDVYNAKMNELNEQRRKQQEAVQQMLSKRVTDIKESAQEEAPANAPEEPAETTPQE